jgi:hypothetical protein
MVVSVVLTMFGCLSVENIKYKVYAGKIRRNLCHRWLLKQYLQPFVLSECHNKLAEECHINDFFELVSAYIEANKNFTLISSFKRTTQI